MTKLGGLVHVCNFIHAISLYILLSGFSYGCLGLHVIELENALLCVEQTGALLLSKTSSMHFVGGGGGGGGGVCVCVCVCVSE